MAESDTILQLGIEAAREGNRDEARNLFGLLTRQEPNNAQAWLWLAGVAEGPEQRRAALERVVELDPTNDMAIKGLQAMGAAPKARTTEPAIPAASSNTVPPPAPLPERAMTDEERYAAELDSAFDDYDALPRAETPPRVDPSMFEDSADTTTSSNAVAPPRTARERSAARRTSTPIHSRDENDDLLVAPQRRPNNMLWLLIGIIAILVAIFLLWNFFFNKGPQVAENPTPAAETATPVSGVGGDTPTTGQPNAGGVITGTDTLTGTNVLTGTDTITNTGDTTPTSETAPPTEAPSTLPPAPVANPNLQAVGVGSELEANGWTFTYPNANYVLPLGKQLGGLTAQGTYLHVLVWAANNTGTDQPLPANFFALKDANNNVYTPQVDASNAGVQRGINADRGLEDAIPANGVLTSIYLVFDVPPGAQGLTLFAAGRNDQGWPLNVVP